VQNKSNHLIQKSVYLWCDKTRSYKQQDTSVEEEKHLTNRGTILGDYLGAKLCHDNTVRYLNKRLNVL